MQQRMQQPMGDLTTIVSGLIVYYESGGERMLCVQADLGKDLSLEILAQQTGFRPYHFARLFRRTTGESPHQFVLRLRIERAQRLLTQTDVPLARIAFESGFANQSHLTRAFKWHLGLTPRAYRQDHFNRADL